MKIRIREWLLTIMSFIIVLYLYTIFTYFGMKEFIQDGVLTKYFDSNIWHVEILVTGVLLGILFMWINRITDNQIFHRKSFGFNIILKSVLYLISLIVVCVITFTLFRLTGLVPADQIVTFLGTISANFLISLLIYYGIFILMMNFILYINKKFGPGSLVDLLMGKYYHPRNEELIFLFLDLRSSTWLAEKLGHHKYSSFLKECIHELTPVIQKYNARVYQYVGDEVVLFWTKKEGLDQLKCLNTYFDFSAKLNMQREHFITTYGQIPKFKAGMDTGVVTATEIGDIKREIAYHGDVLNTASRLEKKCNEFKEDLIISQHLAEQLPSKSKYQFKYLDDMLLQGKTEHVKFYAVSKT